MRSCFEKKLYAWKNIYNATVVFWSKYWISRFVILEIWQPSFGQEGKTSELRPKYLLVQIGNTATNNMYAFFVRFIVNMAVIKALLFCIKPCNFDKFTKPFVRHVSQFITHKSVGNQLHAQRGPFAISAVGFVSWFPYIIQFSLHDNCNCQMITFNVCLPIF